MKQAAGLGPRTTAIAIAIATMSMACGGALPDGGDVGAPEDGGDGTQATDGGSPDGDDRIDPIVVGHSWTYQVTTFGTYPLCPPGEQTGSAVSAATVDGKDAILVKSLCVNAGSSYYAINGDVVQVDYQGSWVLALDAPVSEGHTWSNGASSFTWHDAGAVTVPAGTFHDCWSATQNATAQIYTIFCRGVGPVRWYSKDLSGDGFDAELTGTNFQ